MADLTPMMRQYQDLKSKHPDKILFFRLGDFYEMFQDDALEASRLLGLTLTHRQADPMCGIPFHAAQPYIRKLLDAGKSVAICEQVGIPGSEKGLVKREVVDVLTPGSLTEDGYLSNQNANMTLALSLESDHFSVAVADLSTGEIWAMQGRHNQGWTPILQEIQRFSPREILVSDNLDDNYPGLLSALSIDRRVTITKLPPWWFIISSGHKRLLEQFHVISLQAYGLSDTSAELAPLGALIDYFRANVPQRDLLQFNSVRVYTPQDYVVIDPASAKSLELVESQTPSEATFTLFSLLNQTLTGPGARLLKTRLQFPSVDSMELETRLNQVDSLFQNQERLSQVKHSLSGIPDIERLATRIALNKGGPRDLLGLEMAVNKAWELLEGLHEAPKDLQPEDYWSPIEQSSLKSWAQAQSKALHRSPAAVETDRPLIQENFDVQLDRLRHLRDHSQDVLNDYLLEEQSESNLPQLRIRDNRVIGYYFELSRSRSDQIPAHFERVQTLVGSERYSTPRLRSIQQSLREAEDEADRRERKIFAELRIEAQTHIRSFQSMARWIAVLDVAQSLAQTAIQRSYIRPVFLLDRRLLIENGRHPVVEAHLEGTPFVPNSLELSDAGELLLITGPNMAGKSTFLRQAALIVVLGQMGSFVPATSASWGLVDRVFCRVGASDHLAKGESTFLVEMNETAHILRNATASSLVIMDEVGRGTSTRDGFSLAWAICEYLLDRLRVKTLFATHFHELTALEHPRLRNFSMAVHEDGSSITFLRKVIPGASDQSYGIHVARLAGVPIAVLDRATQILDDLPPEDRQIVPLNENSRPQRAEQLSLWDTEIHPVITRLKRLDVDSLTPRQALQILYELSQEFGSEKQ